MTMHLMTARLFEGLVHGRVVSTKSAFSAERLADLGLTKPNDIARMTRLAQSAGKFNADNALIGLDTAQWTAQDLQWFKRIMGSAKDKYTHLARAGETSIWFHRGGIPSLLFHLKSFPLTAMSKQAYRNARIGDSEMIHQFLFGLATAGMAFAANKLVAGKTDSLNPYDIGVGALQYSNFTGWMPMWANPILALTGMEMDNGRGMEGFIKPAAMAVMSNLAELPGILSSSSVRGLQALPLLGNLYGMPVLWNALKPNHNEPVKPEKLPKPSANAERMIKENEDKSAIFRISDENMAALQRGGFLD
jgi:hypothetical protein